MKKINNKGFALVETLIVSAFIVSIFTIMYTNFYPIMGEYEKRENYDDISLLYSSNLFKKLIEKNKSYPNMASKINSVLNISSSTPYAPNIGFSTYIELKADSFYPDNYTDNEKKDNSSRDCFNVLFKNTDVEAIYLTTYNISNMKNQNLDVQTIDYIKSLPNFNNNPNNLKCRIIVKYKPEGNRESNNKDLNYRYSTIGVDC